jgi:hypothetical protein
MVQVLVPFPPHYQDFDKANPYYAVSGPMSGTYNGFQYVANIWCANNFGASNKLVVELRKGVCPNEGTLIATRTIYITNSTPAQEYTVDFGVQNITFSNESLIVKMDYSEPTNGAFDGHIYWDAVATPSRLHAADPNAVVPTLSEWGLIVLGGLVLAAGTVFILRRRLAFG